MERPLSNFERLHAEVSGKLAPLQGTPFSSSFAHARSSVALASCDLAIYLSIIVFVRAGVYRRASAGPL